MVYGMHLFGKHDFYHQLHSYYIYHNAHIFFYHLRDKFHIYHNDNTLFPHDHQKNCMFCRNTLQIEYRNWCIDCLLLAGDCIWSILSASLRSGLFHGIHFHYDKSDMCKFFHSKAIQIYNYEYNAHSGPFLTFWGPVYILFNFFNFIKNDSN